MRKLGGEEGHRVPVRAWARRSHSPRPPRLSATWRTGTLWAGWFARCATPVPRTARSRNIGRRPCHPVKLVVPCVGLRVTPRRVGNSIDAPVIAFPPVRSLCRPTRPCSFVAPL